MAGFDQAWPELRFGQGGQASQPSGGQSWDQFGKGGPAQQNEGNPLLSMPFDGNAGQAPPQFAQPPPQFAPPQFAPPQMPAPIENQALMVMDKRPLAEKIDGLQKNEQTRAMREARRVEDFLWNNVTYLDLKAVSTFKGLDRRRQKRVLDGVRSLANAKDPTSYILSWSKPWDGDEDLSKRRKTIQPSKDGKLYLSTLPDADHPPARLFHITIPPDDQLCVKGLPPAAPVVIHDPSLQIFTQVDQIYEEILDGIDMQDAVFIDHDPEADRFPGISTAVSQGMGGTGAYAIAVAPVMQRWAAGVSPTAAGRDQAAKLALALGLSFENNRLAESLCLNFESFAKVWKQLVQGTALDIEAVETSMENVPRVLLCSVGPLDVLVKQGMQPDGYAIPFNKNLKDMFSSSSHILSELVDPKEDCQFIDDSDWTAMPGIGDSLKSQGINESYCVATCGIKACWAVGIGYSWKNRLTASKLALGLVVAQKENRLVELCDSYEEFATLCLVTGLITPEQGEAAAQRRKLREAMWQR